MKTQRFALIFFAVFAFAILSVNFVSADGLDMKIINSPSEANHNSDVQITFNITYTGPQDNVTLDFSKSSSNIGSFKDLPTSEFLNKDEFKEFTFTLEIPNHASGNIDATIFAEDINDNSIFFSLPIPTITINDDFSLVIDPETQNAKLDEDTKLITLKNLGNMDFTNLVLTELTNFGISFSENNFALIPGDTKDITVILSDIIQNDIKFGKNNIEVQAQDKNTGINATSTIVLEKEFCSNGENTTSHIEITSVGFDNRGDGTDSRWELLDEIKLEVTVDNSLDDNVNAVLELGLFDENGRNVANDLIFLDNSDADEETYDFDIDDNDNTDIDIYFRIPADIDLGKYRFAIKAYDDDEGEKTSCADSSSDFSDGFYESIEIKKKTSKKDTIALLDFQYPDTLTCGEKFTGSFTAYNVGSGKENKVRIDMKNSDLNIDQSFETFDDLREGDSEDFTFQATIPEDVTNGVYNLGFAPFFDYSSNRDTYREVGNTFIAPITVIGCSAKSSLSSSNALISASLNSDTIVPGETMEVNTKVTNTGTDKATFVIDVSGYSDWATLDDISEKIFSLDAGQTKDLTISLKIKEDATGTQDFTIKTISGDKISTQQLQVTLPENTKDSSFSLSDFGLKDSKYFWPLIIINFILILLIIVVAIKVSRR